MIWTLGAIPLTLLAIGTPIFVLLLTGAILTFVSFLTVSPVAIHQIMFGGLENYALLAIPFFIFAGELMGAAGIADRLIVWVLALIGRVPGSLGVATVGASTLIGAISGASVATVAAVGKALYPGLIRDGYGPRFSSGLVSSSGAIDILIPPSIAMIIFGVLAEESIGRLYLAGFIPGFLLAGIFMFIIAVAAKIWPSVAPREAPPPWRLRFIGLLSLFPVILLMFIVLGTIYLGGATPTEAAAFGVVAAFVLAALNRSVNAHMVKQVMLTTVRTSSMIMLIVTAAFILSFALAILGVPAQLTAMVSQWNLTPLTFVFILVIFYLILGTFMEALSMMVTTMPILVPVLKAMGVDLVWFGIILVILLEAALVSPPEGLNLYIIQGIRKSVSEEAGLQAGTMIDLWIGVLPFMVGMAICLALIFVFPDIALWLPNTVMGK